MGHVPHRYRRCSGDRSQRVAILGNAGGTTARAFGVYYPGARIDGVEIDPAVSAVGRRYFGLGDNPRLTVVTADARPFLATSREKYDLILVDAYRQPYVPFYLATREFFRLARQRLAPGGRHRPQHVHRPGRPSPRRTPSPARWPRSSRRSCTWQALRFNQFVVGLTAPLSRAGLTARLLAAPPAILPDTRLFARDLRQASAGASALDRRPRAGRVGDRQDDRRLRDPRGRHQRSAPPHGPALAARRPSPAPEAGASTSV